MGGRPAQFTADTLPALLTRVSKRNGSDAEFCAFQSRTQLFRLEGMFGGNQDECGRLIALEALLQCSHRGEHEITDDCGRGTEPELAATEAEADHGCEPECGGGSDAENHVAFAENGAGADEADPSEDAQGQAHDIHYGKRRGRLAACREQQIHLDHGYGRGQRDQEHGTETGGMAIAAAVGPEESPGKDGQDQPKSDSGPMEFRTHLRR